MEEEERERDMLVCFLKFWKRERLAIEEGEKEDWVCLILLT